MFSSRQTLIIVVVCATVGGLVLLVALCRAASACRSWRNTPPLPPIQPLAHQREHQRAQFEASLRAQSYNPSFLAAPPPPSRGSKTSLLGSLPSPHASYVATGEGSEELTTLTPLEPPTSPHPLFTPTFSSSINLADSPTQSAFTVPSPSTSALSSPSKHSTTRARPARDDQFHAHHHRPLSVASSLSRMNSRRGLPHGPHSQVEIILPAPLAPGIPASICEHDPPGDRMSIVDRWVPAGRDSISGVAGPSNGNTGAMAGSQVNRRQSASMASNVGGQYVPPVPRVPSMYSRREEKS